MTEKQTFIKESTEQTVIEKVPFKSMIYKPSKGQTFGRPKIKRFGEERDIYDMIQEARADTEIYPTLEKYGCLDRITRDTAAIYGDFTEIKELRNVIEQSNKAEELWKSLPLDMREHFQNNKELFMEGAEEYLTNKIKEQEEKNKTTGADVTDNKGDVTNAQ